MLINDQEQFIRRDFDNEAEIEEVVQRFATQLFGESSIYLPQARISTHGGAGTIPDAVVIDVANREWFVVEAERAAHGTWQHIAPQVSKQLAAVGNRATKDAILQLALQQVRDDEAVRTIFSELDIEDIAIHQILLEILHKEPTIAIPIDAVPKDLKEWIVTLRHRAKIWVIEKYVSVDDESRVLYSIPDENLPTISTRSTDSGAVSTVTRSSSPWRDLWESGVVRDAMPLVLVYGPRGKGKQTFRGLARAEGIEVDGKVYSPSYAAVRCIQAAGSDRRTANGWIMWRTEDGELINELYERAMTEETPEERAPAVRDPASEAVAAVSTGPDGAASEVDKLVAVILERLSADHELTDPIWTDAPAIKVLDCVLSLNRRYDGFVVPRIEAFKERHPGLSSIADLIELIRTYDSAAAFTEAELDYNDPARAETILGVLEYLNEVIGQTEGDEGELLHRWAQETGPGDHSKIGVRGFGIAGLQYLRMLFGVETAKPDVHIIRFVSDVIGREVRDVEALELLDRAARQAGLPLRTADVAIWEGRARSDEREPGS